MTASPDSLQLRSPPAENPALALREFGDDSRQPLRFYLYQDVLEELTFAARYDERIYGAILLGGFGVEDGTGFIEVTGFTGACWVEGVQDLYEELRPACDAWIQSRPDDAIVGLFVAVAGSHGRVDEEMARIHFSLFNIPFQPLLVLDPESGELALSARAPGTKLFNAAFRAVAVRATESLNDEVRSGTPVSASSEEE